METDTGLVQWVPDWLVLPRQVGVLCTTRRGGVSSGAYDDGQHGGGLNLSLQVGDAPSAVERNRAILREHLPSEPVWLMHNDGTTVIHADSGTVDAPWGNAIFTRERGVVCAVLTADALPVLLCDQHGQMVGAARAGWRSLAAGLLENTVAAMQAAGAGELYAWLGAAVGQRKFEVGDDVVGMFVDSSPDRQEQVRSAFTPTGRSGTWIGDFYTLARVALQRAGVRHVSGGGLCTVTNSRRFYSYRRDGVTGRQASAIWLR